MAADKGAAVAEGQPLLDSDGARVFVLPAHTASKPAINNDKQLAERSWRGRWWHLLGQGTPEDVTACCMAYNVPCIPFAWNARRALGLSFWKEATKFTLLTLGVFLLFKLAAMGLMLSCMPPPPFDGPRGPHPVPMDGPGAGARGGPGGMMGGGRSDPVPAGMMGLAAATTTATAATSAASAATATTSVGAAWAPGESVQVLDEAGLYAYADPVPVEGAAQQQQEVPQVATSEEGEAGEGEAGWRHHGDDDEGRRHSWRHDNGNGPWHHGEGEGEGEWEHPHALPFLMGAPDSDIPPECAARVRNGLCALCALLVAAIAYAVYFAARRRQALREQFGIPGSFTQDCFLWACCSLCALSQETRTMMHNQVHDGVWYGEVPGAPHGAPTGQQMV